MRRGLALLGAASISLCSGVALSQTQVSAETTQDATRSAPARAKKKQGKKQPAPRSAAAPAESRNVTLDEIFVYGTSPIINPSPDGLVGASIDRQAIEGLPIGLRVEDIVKRLPAVTTGGAPGEDKDARVLGIDKEFTRTTVEGIPIPDGGEKREFNLDRLPNTFVDSVKIYRLRRAEMDADGLAGQIDIKLRPIPDKQTIDVVGSYGGLDSIHNDSHLASILYGNRFNPNFGAVIGAAHSRIPGAKEKEKLNAAGRVTEREAEKKPVDATDLFADIGFFSGLSEIHIKPKFFELDEDKTKRKDKFTAAGAGNGYETEKENKIKRTIGSDLSGKTVIEAWHDALVDGRVAYYQTTEDKDGKTKNVFRANGTEDAAKREWETENKTDSILQTEGNIAIPLSAGGVFVHTPKAGYLIRHRERERDKTKIVGVTPSVDPKEDYQIAETVYAAYVQDTFRVGSWFSATPGVRFEQANLDVTAGSGVSSSSSSHDFLPSLPVEIKFNDNLSLNAGVSRLINRPKFDELSPYENDSSADKIVIGNPNLRPAMAWAYEAYLRYQQQYFSVGAGWSYRDVTDVIEAVFTGEVRNGKNVEQVMNVGDGWVRAYILEQRIDFGFLPIPFFNGFSITANQTFTDSELVASNGIARRFKDQPPWFANLVVDWRNDQSGTAVSVGFNFTGAFVNEDNGDRRGDETFVDVKITQRLANGINLFVLGQNLTNQLRYKYKTNGETEVERAGRLYMVGLQGKF
jgi:outer membrane receptor for ferrienterochelin and colicin